MNQNHNFFIYIAHKDINLEIVENNSPLTISISDMQLFDIYILNDNEAILRQKVKGEIKKYKILTSQIDSLIENSMLINSDKINK